jgi:hypothetical protein
MREMRKPKQTKIWWPETDPNAKPHEAGFFRSLDSRRLKGAAREEKIQRLMDTLK